jgi:hypothetical protein
MMQPLWLRHIFQVAAAVDDLQNRTLQLDEDDPLPFHEFP